MRVNLQNNAMKPRIKLLSHKEILTCSDTQYVVKENNGYYLATREPEHLGSRPTMHVKFLRDFIVTSKPNQSSRIYKILGSK
jgi:hypothetical protein